jgi:hypothetical protein
MSVLILHLNVTRGLDNRDVSTVDYYFVLLLWKVGSFRSFNYTLVARRGPALKYKVALRGIK